MLPDETVTIGIFFAVSLYTLAIFCIPPFRNISAYQRAALASLNMLPMNVLVHALSRTEPAMGFRESFLWRSLACLIGGAIGCCVVQENPFPRDSLLVAKLAGRGFLGSLGAIFLFLGVSRMQSSSAVAIYSTAPFWTLLFGWVYFREKLDLGTGIGMVLGFVGVLLILKPQQMFSPGGTSASMIQAELLVLGAAVIVGAVGPQIRSIGQQVHYAVLILWLGMVGSVMACAMVVLDGGFGAVLVFSRAAFHDLMMDTSEPGGLDMMRWGRSELCCVSMLAVSSLLGQVCINRAWQDPASGQVTMIHMSCLVLFQFLFDFFSRRFSFPDPLSDFGLLGILLGCSCVIYFKRAPPPPRTSLPHDTGDLAEPLLRCESEEERGEVAGERTA